MDDFAGLNIDEIMEFVPGRPCERCLWYRPRFNKESSEPKPWNMWESPILVPDSFWRHTDEKPLLTCSNLAREPDRFVSVPESSGQNYREKKSNLENEKPQNFLNIQGSSAFTNSDDTWTNKARELDRFVREPESSRQYYGERNSNLENEKSQNLLRPVMKTQGSSAFTNSDDTWTNKARELDRFVREPESSRQYYGERNSNLENEKSQNLLRPVMKTQGSSAFTNSDDTGTNKTREPDRFLREPESSRQYYGERNSNLENEKPQNLLRPVMKTQGSSAFTNSDDTWTNKAREPDRFLREPESSRQYYGERNSNLGNEKPQNFLNIQGSSAFTNLDDTWTNKAREPDRFVRELENSRQYYGERNSNLESEKPQNFLRPFMNFQDLFDDLKTYYTSGSNASSLESVSEASASSSYTASNDFCGFCKKNGESVDVFMSHKLRNRWKEVTCPVLFRHVCEHCGATGRTAHTATYCPIAPQASNGRRPVSTSVIVKSSMRKSNGQLRNHKHSRK